MTSQEPTWMTIREAALALAVSELTVRRRIKDGRLRHKLINGKYYIDLQSSPGMIGSGEDTVDHAEHLIGRDDQAVPRMITHNQRRVRTTDPPVDRVQSLTQSGTDSGENREQPSADDRPVPGIDLDAFLAEHARLAEVAGRAGLLQEQYAELTARHEELRAGMLSLAGRNGWLESKLEERESELKLLTDQQHRSSWWKRLFGPTLDRSQR